MQCGQGRSIGVLDDLYCRVLVLRVKKKTFLWITLDLCLVENVMTEYVREVFAAKYSILKENIVISTIHTHAGPDISFLDEGPERNRAKAEYREWLVNHMIKAVDRCFLQGFVETTPYGITGMVHGIYGCRNYQERQGDKQISIILFRSQNHVAAGIFHFSCHPTVLGMYNRKISSDLLGGIGKALDKKYNTNFITIQGASGDMGNRQFRQGNDEKELHRVIDAVMEQVDQIADAEGAEKPFDILDGVTDLFDYQVEIHYDKEDLQRQLDETRAKLSHAETEDQRKLWGSGVLKLEQKIKTGKTTVQLPSFHISLGDLEFVTIPGELFSAFGEQIKKSMHGKICLIWGYANYNGGYLVEKQEFGKGYESLSTQLLPGYAEIYVEKIIERIKEKRL